MPRPQSKTLGYLYDRFIGDDPERVAAYEAARADAEAATMICDLIDRGELTVTRHAAQALAEAYGALVKADPGRPDDPDVTRFWLLSVDLSAGGKHDAAVICADDEAAARAIAAEFLLPESAWGDPAAVMCTPLAYDGHPNIIMKSYERSEPHYLALVRNFPLRPIRSEEALDRAIAVVDDLLDKDDLTQDEQDYLDVLGDLVEEYESDGQARLLEKRRGDRVKAAARDLLAVAERIVANCGAPGLRHEYADGKHTLSGCSMTLADIEAARAAIAEATGCACVLPTRARDVQF